MSRANIPANSGIREACFEPYIRRGHPSCRIHSSASNSQHTAFSTNVIDVRHSLSIAIQTLDAHSINVITL